MKSVFFLLFSTIFLQFSWSQSIFDGATINSTGIILLQTEDSKAPDSITIDDVVTQLDWQDGKSQIQLKVSSKGQLVKLRMLSPESNQYIHISARKDGRIRSVVIPPWTSILPPLIAVLLALLIKEVVFSLFGGILIGSFIIHGCRFDGILHTFNFIFDTVSGFILGSLNDSGHLSVIVFSLLIGGMVSLITKNGGMMGILIKLGKYAVSRKRVQLTTYLLGIAIFFDDYANTLIVGNTMRSLSDKFRISREKLAYIVDSTAAPVSAVAFITTWIGAELGFIETGLNQLDSYPFGISPYHIFLQSLKYSFYPILTLIFIYLLIKSGKDYGSMKLAEKRAFETGEVMSKSQQTKDEPNMEDLAPVEGAKNNWHYAFWPVITTIIVTILGLLITGMENAQLEISDLAGSGWGSTWAGLSLLAGGDGFFLKCGTLLGLSDSYQALLWSSFSGLIVAVILTVGSKTMSIWDVSHWSVQGFKTMIPAIVILILAWALASTTEQLGTADFIISLCGSGFHPAIVPILIFLMAFSISFATGSSWSTMAILYPLAIPLAWEVSLQYGLSPEAAQEIMLNSIATVLAASVLGDHCSPISDTTILSSLASDCNHLDHVKTQLPYALTVGGVSLLCIAISAVLGGGWLYSFVFVIIGAVLLYGIIHKFGEVVE